MKAYTSVKEWYQAAYSSDELGAKIGEFVTFERIALSLKAGKYSYSLFFADDSIVRERIFTALAEMCKVSYDKIYNLWRAAENVDTNGVPATDEDGGRWFNISGGVYMRQRFAFHDNIVFAYYDILDRADEAPADAQKFWYLPKDCFFQPNGLVKEIYLTEEEHAAALKAWGYIYDNEARANERAND